ncbi:class III poly(R)-hydroxyalkanoic acid synthase subunit PhaE [Pseudomarimonas salicorniae]|uniref:Poly(3-hydroxyalkanoate) polymerase subunit PhaE n=1 Tax=Pseudomarimonas salicorniae TaxID=2933270 RepID=A0ABT0GFZ8_9GAMM|nr:class III poly(R)-hydroxyalkanoic acid synthase subunit PhaE [Lysobacter sp. CAU 1642]MCK7593282.1 class III poly(R)-hydroxyalkanoic acid synthase subunit PhaE [Lysobacter sp. CAU 1642]
MAGKSSADSDLFAAGKQFWDSWTGLARDAMGADANSWSSPAAAFGRVMPESMSDAGHAAQSMAEQGRQFMEFLQAAAGRMGAGEPLDAGKLAGMWRGALGEGNPMLDALRAVNGEGARGFEKAGQDLMELLEPMRRSIESQFQLPAFGYSRERQQHWQALQQAASDHARAQAEYNALLVKASQRGMERFENKLVERSEPGRQLDTARAVYDLWVDAAEEAYAEVAMSPDFRSAYGELVNTQMRLRQRVQAEAEQHAAQLGMPTRSEMDGTHRKLQQMSRELRALRAELAALRGGNSASPAKPARRESAPATGTGRKRAPTAKKAAARKPKSTASKAGAKKSAPRRSS